MSQRFIVALLNVTFRIIIFNSWFHWKLPRFVKFQISTWDFTWFEGSKGLFRPFNFCLFRLLTKFDITFFILYLKVVLSIRIFRNLTFNLVEKWTGLDFYLMVFSCSFDLVLNRMSFKINLLVTSFSHWNA